ncbi:MAG: hypothetical protein H7A43_10035 [Verrucomicrobia bacterium]|nr:hypothetical protein [Kiritimatiellia bacterium]MCB1101784.1 hypothetical protein [Kiritimatiellia bacterium]MCP5488973.1 hypothetical protein [Verrucomicrobiota bacterium]
MCTTETPERIYLKAKGISMGSVWGPSALLGVRPVVAGEVVPLGSVLVFELGGHVIAHRVIRRMRKDASLIYITQGDGYGRPDALPVPEGAVRGVVEWVESGGETLYPDRWFHRWRRWAWLRIKGAVYSLVCRRAN